MEDKDIGYMEIIWSEVGIYLFVISFVNEWEKLKLWALLG